MQWRDVVIELQGHAHVLAVMGDLLDLADVDTRHPDVGLEDQVVDVGEGHLDPVAVVGHQRDPAARVEPQESQDQGAQRPEAGDHRSANERDMGVGDSHGGAVTFASRWPR